jgi:hypothetical protein
LQWPRDPSEGKVKYFRKLNIENKRDQTLLSSTEGSDNLENHIFEIKRI